MAANGYQLHILMGNLGADPKVHTTRSGQKVCNFDIAVNERNSDGTEVVTWYSIAAWNGLGDVCAQYLAKGRSVMVEGTRMTATAWPGRDGNLYTRMELTANEVKFLGGNGTPASNGGSNGGSNGHYNNTNAYKQSQAPKQRPTSQSQRQAQRPTSQPQRSTSQPQHQRKQAPASRHEQEYFVPDHPDEIPF